MSSYEAEQRSRFERLPKWAQYEITRLKLDAESWKAKALEGPAEYDVFVTYGFTDRKIVRFQLDHERWDRYIDAYLVKHGDETVLTIHGGRTFDVRPHSSNLIHVRTER